MRWFSIVPGSGYGNASEEYLSGLRAAGIPVSWVPMGWAENTWNSRLGPLSGPDVEGLSHRDIANRSVEHDTVVVHSSPVWHDQLVADSSGKLLASLTTWETDRLSDQLVAIMNRYSRVIVPSRFNASVFESSGVTTPIRVVPHVARDIALSESKLRGTRKSSRGGGSPARAKDGTFVFYTIASWTTRKAVVDTIEAYLDAFDKDDDVLLVVHTTEQDHIARGRIREREASNARARALETTSSYTLAKLLGGRADPPEILLSTRILTRTEVDELHFRGDCFVSLSRGEGFGLGAFEAATFGNPVIVTGWSAPLEFLPEAYPYLVDFDLVPTVTDEPDDWYVPSPGDNWAKARIPHASALMREIFERREEGVELGRSLRPRIVSEFGRASVTNRLVEALESGTRRAAKPLRSTR